MNKGVLDELKFFDIKNCFLIDDRLPSYKVRFENCNEIKLIIDLFMKTKFFKRICIVDYGAGNVNSVKNMLRKAGVDSEIIDDGKK